MFSTVFYLFVSLPITKLDDILKMNETILMQIGTSGLWSTGHKTISFDVRSMVRNVTKPGWHTLQ